MKITRNHLRGLIIEEIEHVKVMGDIEQAMNKITGNTRALSDLVSKGEVSVDIGDAKVTVKAEKPLTTHVLHDLPADQIISDIQSDIKNLDIVVQKRVGKGKRITGKITNPFNPKSKDFGFNIKLKGNF
tara:strand:- start:20023 stop:20409 length:387 start_codon:yes stop_codon:yes gene_type:complete